MAAKKKPKPVDPDRLLHAGNAFLERMANDKHSSMATIRTLTFMNGPNGPTVSANGLEYTFDFLAAIRAAIEAADSYAPERRREESQERKADASAQREPPQ